MPSSRQLAAIMFTDIVGYTALMGEDEQKAFELLKKNRQLQKPLIEQNNGRWIKELGDGVLASFATVSDAVNTAIKIQEACNLSKEFLLRIGIHHGEVVFEDGDIFGDAVNIASRLQALAPIGGIWVSESVHNNVANKKGIESHFVKEEKLKNVKESVKVYEILLQNSSSLQAPSITQSDFYQASSTLKKNRSASRKTIFIFSGIVILLLAGYLLYHLFYKTEKENTPNNAEIIEKSIAVLPFVNMSGDKNQEYFSDGLSEELLNLLARIPKLKVIGRTSSFSFKGKTDDLRTIAHTLGVDHILEGSVRKDENKIRVSAKLIKAADGSQLWSESYDRDLEGIFKLQDEIAGAVVKQLQLKLLAVPVSSSSPLNTEAYNLLLQGNYFADKRDRANVAKAFDLYLQALALDSLNARAWAALAKCYNLQAAWGWTGKKGFEDAKKAAIKAIALDDKHAEAYRSLGEAKMYNFDWLGAEVEYEKALNLEPGNADVLRIMGLLATAQGRLDEAIRLDKQSLAFDPIRPITYLHLGLNLYYSNRLDEAIVALKKALELNPQFPRAHTYLGKVYLTQGKPKMALEAMKQETDETWKGYSLALCYQALGRQKESDEQLRNYIARFQKTNTSEIAEIYAFRGENDKAFEWLEKAYNSRAARLIWFKNNPVFKNIMGDRRYAELLKKMHLPVD